MEEESGEYRKTTPERREVRRDDLFGDTVGTVKRGCIECRHVGNETGRTPCPVRVEWSEDTEVVVSR